MCIILAGAYPGLKEGGDIFDATPTFGHVGA